MGDTIALIRGQVWVGELVEGKPTKEILIIQTNSTLIKDNEDVLVCPIYQGEQKHPLDVEFKLPDFGISWVNCVGIQSLNRDIFFHYKYTPGVTYLYMTKLSTELMKEVDKSIIYAMVPLTNFGSLFGKDQTGMANEIDTLWSTFSEKLEEQKKLKIEEVKEEVQVEEPVEVIPEIVPKVFNIGEIYIAKDGKTFNPNEPEFTITICLADRLEPFNKKEMKEYFCINIEKDVDSYSGRYIYLVEITPKIGYTFGSVKGKKPIYHYSKELAINRDEISMTEKSIEFYMILLAEPQGHGRKNTWTDKKKQELIFTYRTYGEIETCRRYDIQPITARSYYSKFGGNQMII